MAGQMIRALLALAALGVGTWTAAAQEAGEPTTFAGPQVVAGLVDPAEKLFVWRDIRIQLAIINGNAPVGIEAIAVAVPAGAAWASGNGDAEFCPQCVNVNLEPFEMKTPGERRDLGVVYLRAIEWSALPRDQLGFLFYRPRKEVFLVNLKYKPLADASGASRVQAARLEGNVSAHPLGMYLGALVGVILATALVVCYRVTKQLSGTTGAQGGGSGDASGTDRAGRGAPDARQAAGSAPWWLRLVRGALASLIAILLFQTTSDVAFPISVSVHDFYGGVLLGLFGDKVAEAIWSRI